MSTPSPNSLVSRVTAFVESRARATFSEVVAEFPGYTRKQVHAALENARDRRLIKVILRGNFRGKRESVWAPGAHDRPPPPPKKDFQPIASVWELGMPTIKGPWPPRFDGGQIHQLEDEEEAA